MDKLREEFFEKHTETKDGIPKVITHPHNLYEWFKENIQSQQRELLEAYTDSLNQSRLLNCRVYKDEIDDFLASNCG